MKLEIKPFAQLEVIVNTTCSNINSSDNNSNDNNNSAILIKQNEKVKYS